MAQLATESPDEHDRRLTRAAWEILMRMPDDGEEFLALCQRLWDIAARDLKMPLPAWPSSQRECESVSDDQPASNVTPLRRGAVTVLAVTLAFALQLGDAPRKGLVQASGQADVQPIGIDPVIGRELHGFVNRNPL